MTFGQFIKVFMTDAGMNQKQLAEKIGISTPVMCDILTNKRGFYGSEIQFTDMHNKKAVGTADCSRSQEGDCGYELYCNRD